MNAFQRDRIQEVYKEKYPHLFENTNTIKDNHDLLRFIADEVIDLRIFKDMPTATRQATGNETIPLVHRMVGEPQSPGRNSRQAWESEFDPYAAYEMR